MSALRHITAIAALAATIAFTSGARANGRFPASNAIAFDPSNANRIYLRTTFGALVSSDGGRAWDWLCERAIGFSGPEDPAMGVLGDGSLAMTLFEGLSVSHDGACSFAFEGGPADKKVFVDIAVRSTQPAAAVAITSGYANKTDDAGAPLFSSEVFVTTDSARTWKVRGAPFDPTILLETIDWSGTNDKRMYASGVRGSGATPTGVLLRSTDGGATWTEKPIPLIPPHERAAFIAALDPSDEKKLFVRTVSGVDGGSRLLLTTDAGATWKTLATLTGPMKGFALSADGKTVYAGGPKDGLQVGRSPEFKLEKRSDVQIQCLGLRQNDLWACSNEASGFVAGVSNDEGKSFQVRAHLKDIRGPLTCPDSSRAAQLCKADWPSQRASLGIESPSPPPSSPPPTSTSTSTSTPTPTCTCDVVGSSQNQAPPWLLGVGIVVMRLRSRLRLRLRLR